MGEKGLQEQVGEHFGRVPTYTLFDTENNSVRTIENTTLHTGGAGYAPDMLAKEGVNVMLCGGMGRRAIELFEQHGIMAYVGAKGTVEQTLQMHREGELTPATSETACAQHAFRGEGHGDGHRHGNC